MQRVGRYQNKSSFKTRRSELRTYSTHAEWKLWSRLRNKQLSVKFRRQYNIDYYIVDFYCHELKLIIELDGWVHGEKEQRIHDAQRGHYLQQKGYTIVHYRNEQIKYQFELVLGDILDHITRLSH